MCLLPPSRSAAYRCGMSPSDRPRGPLPARVYWIRRAVVLGVPLLLVLVIIRVLGGSVEGSDPDQATQAAAKTKATAEPNAEVLGPNVAESKTGKKGKNKPSAPAEPVLPDPSGPCANDDIVVTPAITKAPGGADIPIAFNLRTRESEACTWQASAETLTITITSGSDHIWSTRECPAAIQSQDVVVRRDFDTPVEVIWNARRSEGGCASPSAKWALPGWYHIEAAAWAGEPTDVQFELVAPAPAVITKTVKPKPKKSGNKNGKKSNKKNGNTSHQPGADGEGNSVG